MGRVLKKKCFFRGSWRWIWGPNLITLWRKWNHDASHLWPRLNRRITRIVKDVLLSTIMSGVIFSARKGNEFLMEKTWKFPPRRWARNNFYALHIINIRMSEGFCTIKISFWKLQFSMPPFGFFHYLYSVYERGEKYWLIWDCSIKFMRE